MLEASIFLSTSFIILALNYFLNKDIFYPPTLFSIIWTTVILSYIIFLFIRKEINYIVDIRTLVVILVGQVLFSLSGFIAFVAKFKKHKKITHQKYSFKFPIEKVLTFFLLIMFPLYLKAIISIAENSEYAKINFYLALRHEYVNNEVNLGFLDYLNIISVFNFALFQYKENFTENIPDKKLSKISFKVLVYSISFGYAFLSTGRTYFALLLSLYIAFKAIPKKIKRYHFIFGIAFFLLLFVVNALILNKGASVNNSFLENVASITENFTIYFLGGLYGFDHFMKGNIAYDYGENVFRFFSALSYSFGLVDSKPKALIMPFISNPIVSNVYSLYYNYFKDFGYLGLLFNLIWGYIHTSFYVQAKRRNSFLNVYVYAILVYPLVMSFFQDQYMSLLSTWIQLIFYGLIANIFIRKVDHG